MNIIIQYGGGLENDGIFIDIEYELWNSFLFIAIVLNYLYV